MFITIGPMSQVGHCLAVDRTRFVRTTGSIGAATPAADPPPPGAVGSWAGHDRSRLVLACKLLRPDRLVVVRRAIA